MEPVQRSEDFVLPDVASLVLPVRLRSVYERLDDHHLQPVGQGLGPLPQYSPVNIFHGRVASRRLVP